MPDLVKYSDLKDSHPASIDGTNDLLALAHPDENSETGYVSFTVSPNDLGKHAVEDMTFVNLQTNDKHIEGAINEIKNDISGSTWTDLTATLLAGSTSVTIQHPSITANSTIQVFENVGAFSDLVEPTDIVTTTGQVVITFPAQSNDLSVKVRVS